MRYKIESIGASFSDNNIRELSQKLTSESSIGWEFHSVFSVQKTGCSGQSEGTTYLAIFVTND